MSFAVSADAHDRFMGRYSVPLASEFAGFAGVDLGCRVRDVGCGPGALTSELVMRVGGTQVAAVDPSATFADAVRVRHPSIDVDRAGVGRLPFPDDAFDLALAQLVVHFMSDPVGGLREMGRVTKPGGVVAASVWDFDEGGSPLTLFWAAARELDSLEDWWDPFELGVDPAGSYLSTLPPPARRRLKEHCRERLPSARTVTAIAWAARGSVTRP